ncbi:MAG: type I-E CRISPR-associated protein Cse1/CasA [Phenylobacterium sp.]
MHETYNLCNENWIRTTSGRQSLKTFFQNAHLINNLDYDDLLTNFAIMRFSLPFIYRAYGVNNSNEWKSVWSKGKFDDAIIEYIEKWEHKFDLFSAEYPFYQDKEIAGHSKTKEVSTNKLRMISDNESAVFEKSFGFPELSFADAASNLVSYQLMSLCVGRGLMEKRSFFFAANGYRYPVMLFGNNLFESLMLNCMPLEHYKNSKDDKPFWETDFPNGYNVASVNGYMDYLTRPCKRVLLQSRDGAVKSLRTFEDNKKLLRNDKLEMAIQYIKENIKDPFVIYMRDKKDYKTTQHYNQRFWKNFANLKLSSQGSDDCIFKNHRNVSYIDDDVILGYSCLYIKTDSKLCKFKDVSIQKLLLQVKHMRDEDLSFMVEDYINSAVVICDSFSNSVRRILRLIKAYDRKLYPMSDYYTVNFWNYADLCFKSFRSELLNKKDTNNLEDTRKDTRKKYTKLLAHEANRVLWAIANEAKNTDYHKVVMIISDLKKTIKEKTDGE